MVFGSSEDLVRYADDTLELVATRRRKRISGIQRGSSDITALDTHEHHGQIELGKCYPRVHSKVHSRCQHQEDILLSGHAEYIQNGRSSAISVHTVDSTYYSQRHTGRRTVFDFPRMLILRWIQSACVTQYASGEGLVMSLCSPLLTTYAYPC